MRVPVRRQPETRVSEQQQGYARPVQPLNIEPLTQVVEGFRDQLLDEQDDRQRVELNRRLLTEVNELQEDFVRRQRDPEVSPIDFADNTETAYSTRHSAILEELRGAGFRQELLDDFDARLGTVRQGFFVRGLEHQVSQLASRAVEQAEDTGLQASQYAAVDPINNYASARDLVVESVRTNPDLTEEQRAAIEDEQLAIVRDGAARALAIQNPQLVIDTFDPQGLTAPGRSATTAGGATVTAAPGSWQSVATTVASELGLDPIEVAAVMSYESAGSFDPARMGGRNNQYMGLIQFGPEERRTYGITATSTPEQWTQAILGFMRDRGFRRGMSLLDFYSTINAGRPGRYNASDGNGTVRSHYDTILREHRASAERWLASGAPIRAGAGGQSASRLAGDPVQTVDLPPSQVRQQSDMIGVTETAVPQPRVAGNLPLNVRSRVTNPDGTVSTVRTISIGTDAGEVLIPTVINGEVVSDEEAVAHYRETGENFGTFASEEEATAYAQSLSRQHAGDLSSIITGNPLLDDLNGRERIQLLGLAREQMNRVTATQRAEMDVRIGNITAEAMQNGGEIAAPIPTEAEVIQVYGAVEGPQRWAQINQARETGRAIVTFRTQSATDIQAALDQLEPDPGSPTYATELQIYQNAERAAQTLLTQREADPAAYAMQHFPAVREAAQRGTNHYYAALDRAYETLGIDARNAPVMTDAATQQITEQYRSMNPSQRREFMRQNMAQMGEERFRRFVRGMEGTTAEVDARIFALLRTYPVAAGPISSIYQQILEGREIIAQDPARRPRSEQVLTFFRDNGLRAVENLNAEASRAIQEAAEGLYVQRGGDPVNIDRRLYRESLATVLGGNMPANMARGQARFHTILPPGTNQQQFEAFIERQTLESLRSLSTDGRWVPRYGDLRTVVPIQDIIDDGVFVMVSPGRYMIRMASDGRPLMTSQGQPLLLNIHRRDVVR